MRNRGARALQAMICHRFLGDGKQANICSTEEAGASGSICLTKYMLRNMSPGESFLWFTPELLGDDAGSPCTRQTWPRGSNFYRLKRLTARRPRSGADCGPVWRHRVAPTRDEIEEFVVGVEEKDDSSKRFVDKYNFDVFNDVPLSGRFEWGHVRHKRRTYDRAVIRFFGKAKADMPQWITFSKVDFISYIRSRAGKGSSKYIQLQELYTIGSFSSADLSVDCKAAVKKGVQLQKLDHSASQTRLFILAMNVSAIVAVVEFVYSILDNALFKEIWPEQQDKALDDLNTCVPVHYFNNREVSEYAEH
ncbi:hypothetical protein SELMODRAFT_429501 [Selaginella moellendorffii]|uniref:Cyclin-dependent kinase inhibitor domain-containing protein n=1 Tax=Selaginella moellendorffii TaxID=88036 RepID=D8T6D8_SELML|nr:hypothetical protein SELMODRAFT_429501 [Selaginella moellendorffii]